MGRSLSVKVGYGIIVPTNEDNEDYQYTEKLTDFLKQFNDNVDEDDEDEDEYASVDWWEAEQALKKEFPLISLEIGYAEDYKTDSILVISRSSADGYYGPAQTPPFLATDEELEQLYGAAKLLGAPSSEVSYVANACYG